MPQCTLPALIGLCLCTKRPGPNIGHSCFCGVNDAVIVKSNCPNQIPKVFIRCTSRVKAMICISDLLLLLLLLLIGAVLTQSQGGLAMGGRPRNRGSIFGLQIGFGCHPATFPKPTGSSGCAMKLIIHPVPRLRINRYYGPPSTQLCQHGLSFN